MLREQYLHKSAFGLSNMLADGDLKDRTIYDRNGDQGGASGSTLEILVVVEGGLKLEVLKSCMRIP